MSDPWFKFYPSDWRNDPALKMCSLAARGLWVELICLMHQATPYGHLLVNGQSPTDAQLAVLVGAPPDQITAMLGELESAGIFSRTRKGVIYSRKLTRMSKKAATARNNGRKGGNPTLSNQRSISPSDNPEVKGGLKPQKPEPELDIVEDTNVSSLSSGDDPPAKPIDQIAQAVSAYNAAATESGWPRCQVLSKARRSALAARLRDSGGLAGWQAALAKAQGSSHCCGQNDRGWTASFDFLTRQSSFTKLLEGNYDDRTPPGGRYEPNHAQRPTPRPENRPDPALEQIARLAGLGAAQGHGCG